MRKQREGTINIFDTHIGVWEECGERDRDRVFEQMKLIHARLVTFMSKRFEVQPDPSVRSSLISDCYWVGKRGDLEFNSEVGGRTFKIEFFQEKQHDNPNGGRYDSSKIRRMAAVSRKLRLECITEMWRVVRWLVALGYHIEIRDERLEPSLRMVRDLAEGTRPLTPLEKFDRSWQSHRFERDETGWPSQKVTRQWPDSFRQGEFKFARKDGRLAYGQVFDGINGSWDLISNGEIIVYNGAPREFFDCPDPKQAPRRHFRDLEKRMRSKLEKAFKNKEYRLVAGLGGALDRHSRDPLREAVL